MRIGKDVFAAGLETIKDQKPLNNCRRLFFKRTEQGPKLVQADPKGRTREPCPLVGFPDGRLFLPANPTLFEEIDAPGEWYPDQAASHVTIQGFDRRPLPGTHTQ